MKQKSFAETQMLHSPRMSISRPNETEQDDLCRECAFINQNKRLATIHLLSRRKRQRNAKSQINQPRLCGNGKQHKNAAAGSKAPLRGRDREKKE
jgi:hypothetical protein